ncbi:hypothetical protein MNV49_004920 [Pseudohyphozyma bogoriensis]|nr:hypothetical protein MNV49_004920 [Pseudohyphozyma bogoriensis]
MSLPLSAAPATTVDLPGAELLKGILSTSPPATVSLIGSLCIAILWVVGLPAGYLFDQGYCKWEIVGGSIFFLGGMFGLSVSKTYYQCVLAYGVAVGIGGGFLFSPAMSAVGSYFYKRRASTIGIVICGAAIGAVIFPIFFNKAFPGLGFGSTIRIAAYFQTGCFVIGNLLIRPRDLPRKDLPPTLPLIKSFLKEPMTWLVNGGCAFAMLGIFVPQFYFQTYLESKNAPQVLISYGYALINSTAAITRATIGLAADRFGFLNSILPVAYYCTLMIYVMVAANSTGGYIAYALFFGIANGAWVSLMTPCIMLLANNVNEIGVRIGLGYLFLAIPTLIGSPIAGALLTRAGGYWAPF